MRIGRLGAGVLLTLVLMVTVQAQGAGVIEGTVVNGTSGGPEIGAGVAVTLHVRLDDIEMDTQETITDAAGSFVFEGLDTDPAIEYWLEAVYLDVAYNSAEPYRFADEQPILDATVTVYETTDDDSAVVLNSVHLIAQSFGEVLRISEIHLFGNSGDRAYVGSDGTTVFLPLPPSAVGVAFDDAAAETRFIQVDGGFADTEPVPPGQETSLVFFSYHLIASGDRIPLERSFDYPVDNLSVLVTQPGLELKSEQLQSMGAQLFEGQQYEFFVGQSLAADAPLLLELMPVEEAVGIEGGEGMPSAGGESASVGSTRGNQGTLRWIGYVLAGLAALGAIVYAATSRRPSVARTSASALQSNPKARRLLADLADLEDAYEAGQVDDAKYERRRTELREAIKALA